MALLVLGSRLKNHQQLPPASLFLSQFICSCIFILEQYLQCLNDFSLQCLVKCCTKIRLYYTYRVLIIYLVWIIKSSEREKKIGLVNSNFSSVYQPTPAIMPASLVARTCLFFSPGSFSPTEFVFWFPISSTMYVLWFCTKWKEVQLSERAGTQTVRGASSNWKILSLSPAPN